MHHGRTIALSLEPGADPAKEVSKMCRNHGKKGANTDRIFKRGICIYMYVCIFCIYIHRMSVEKVCSW